MLVVLAHNLVWSHPTFFSCLAFGYWASKTSLFLSLGWIDLSTWKPSFAIENSLALSLLGLCLSTYTLGTKSFVDSCLFVVGNTTAYAVKSRWTTSVSSFFIYKLPINILEFILFLGVLLLITFIWCKNSSFLGLRCRGTRVPAIDAEVVMSLHILVLVFIASAIVCTWVIAEFLFFIVFDNYFFEERSLSSDTWFWWALAVIVDLVSIFIFKSFKWSWWPFVH